MTRDDPFCTIASRNSQLSTLRNRRVADIVGIANVVGVPSVTNVVGVFDVVSDLGALLEHRLTFNVDVVLDVNVVIANDVC